MASRNGSTPNGGKRNWSELPADEWERIAKIYEKGSAAQFVQEAAQLGTNTDALGRQVRSYRLVERKLQKRRVRSQIDKELAWHLITTVISEPF